MLIKRKHLTVVKAFVLPETDGRLMVDLGEGIFFALKKKLINLLNES
jgi:hypothetical protein